jgi:4-cresol dehydrogenase (hydroxylating)
MNSSKSQSLQTAWKIQLPHLHTLSGDLLAKYEHNATNLYRKITAVLIPRSKEEVRQIVAVAIQNQEALYPVSCGKNWGYGSSLPVVDHCTIVDLSELREIRHSDPHYVEIEPGVTQEDLWKFLREKNMPSFFNCTGAGCRTSILGNALDRGFGYLGLKPDDISCLEVVLGNGDVLNTGFSHYGNSKTAASYPHGLGPSLDGLFCQSNFGIVTSARFALKPRLECHAAAIFTLRHTDHLSDFIDTLAQLRREGVFDSVFHFGNPSRASATLGPLIYKYLLDNGHLPGAETRQRALQLVADNAFSTWTGNTAIRGTKAAVDLIFAEFQSSLGHLANIRRIDADDLNEQLPAKTPADAVHRELLNFTLAIPSDATLQAPFWAMGEFANDPVEELDPGKVGVLFCCPTLPFDSQSMIEVIALTEKKFAQYGFDSPCVTCNAVNAGTLIAVINLFFRRDQPDETKKAHQCVDELYDTFATLGYYPYRIGIQTMDKFINPNDVFWKTVKALKSALDPANIIAPGRYCFQG